MAYIYSGSYKNRKVRKQNMIIDESKLIITQKLKKMYFAIAISSYKVTKVDFI